MVATPRASIRYVGGSLDGFSESGASPNSASAGARSTISKSGSTWS